GNFSHSYQYLTSFFVEVKLVDHDLVFDIQTTTCKDKRFIRCFWCFGAPKKMYHLLRPVVVIDKTFLKGRHRGTLLTTLSIDPNNHLLPLAFSITNTKNIDSWTYFLEMFGSNFHGFQTRSSSSLTETLEF
ncbi:hypothetical protein GIB67_021688, partial [Kingdonia uniflora]